MPRSRKFSAWMLEGAFVSLVLPIIVAGPTEAQPARIYLHKNWQIQSSCEVKAVGEQISLVSFDAKGWHKAEVPATVVGALVTDKTYPDPNYGTNLKSFPGMNYSDKNLFANQEMPDGSPFRCSWWYRREFTTPAGEAKKIEWLNFLGINYRANIWINGQKVADANDVAGTYRSFEFNVSKFLNRGKANVLAVEVFAPGKDDLGITWVDWNPTPPDKDMGIWKEVFLTSSGSVAVRNPFVASRLDAEYKTAELTISGEVRNVSNEAVKGVLRAEVEGIELQQNVELTGGESKSVKFTPEQFAKLKLANPRLWWPYQMGTPHLYTANLSFEIGKQVSDAASATFGIREVTSELTDKGHLLFKVNGRKVLIRGAAWAPDLLFRWSSARLDADLAYVRDMGMNTIRLEGRLDRDEFFDKTDRLGILVMPGWTCCDAWERWNDWKNDQNSIAVASLRDQITRLRNHPSVFVWLNGSDNPPPANVEKIYLDIEKELQWPNPIISSASEQKAAASGESGVKMTGPYEYVPPVYWLADTQAGGAYGYNTETSPGPAIPTRESLEKFIPKDHLWPIDEVWNYHAGGERFTTVNVFTDGLNRRYGQASSLEDYERKAQAMTYDGQRAMFEAYARNKYTSTGVIQWMLNNAWPSLIWHLYDYYLAPAGGYFGTKKACETVHVQYSYDDNSVAVINGTYEPLKGTKVSAKMYSLDAKEKASRETTLDLEADSSTKAFDLPTPDGLTPTYFLKLELHDATGKLVSENFYWLSTKADVLDWAKRSDTVYTPQKEFGDLSGLNTLPTVKVAITKRLDFAGKIPLLTVIAENKSNSVAFMVHPRLTRGKGGEDVTPVFWSDNYFSLLPGEKKSVSVRFDSDEFHGATPELVLEGWNVEPTAP
ncbi:MAG TPA: beta galactosidase jelly roll domain-containing protein [Candidatus Acidoferrales bacterium]|nr:beta galactosidase jelly roll domain-containing protein [Candidatus Acidoferrales bacterium]